MYDLLGSSHKQPLFFVLERQENRTVFPTEAVKPPGEVLPSRKVIESINLFKYRLNRKWTNLCQSPRKRVIQRNWPLRN